MRPCFEGSPIDLSRKKKKQQANNIESSLINLAHTVSLVLVNVMYVGVVRSPSSLMIVSLRPS
jgi:hypothetical protein